MPYRVPDNRPNERTEKGEQPYTDDREAMSQKDAELQNEAEGMGEREHESEDQRRARLESEAEESFEHVQEELESRN